MHILFCVNNIKFGTKCFVKVEQFVLPFIGIVVASVVTAVAMVVCKYFMEDSSVILRFCIGCLCCMVCYLTCIVIMRVPIFIMFTDMIKKKKK